MRLQVHAAGLVLPSDERRWVDRIVRLSLGRHAARVRAGRVSLSHGGDAQAVRCRIRLRLHEDDPIRVEGRGRDAGVAVRGALWRLTRRLERRNRMVGARWRPAPAARPRDAQGGT